MLGPLLLVLAKYNYLPETFTDVAIIKQVEKLINDIPLRENLLTAIKEINKLLNLTPQILFEDLKELSGPYCDSLRLNLEVPCSLKSCPRYRENFQWNCLKSNATKETFNEVEVIKAITSFTQQITSSILKEHLPPKWVAIESLTRCIKCGTRENLESITKKQVVCKKCLDLIPGKKLALQLELEFGRPTLEILIYLVKTWHSVQEQAQVLGLSSDNIYELCEAYCLNPKRYKTVKDRYFSNPFHSRKKGRISIDGLVFRLYFHYLNKRKTQNVRLEILELNDYLLNTTNQFLQIRGLMLFHQTIFK